VRFVLWLVQTALEGRQEEPPVQVETAWNIERKRKDTYQREPHLDKRSKNTISDTNENPENKFKLIKKSTTFLYDCRLLHKSSLLSSVATFIGSPFLHSITTS
jgi:hypothetical protein